MNSKCENKGKKNTTTWNVQNFTITGIEKSFFFCILLDSPSFVPCSFLEEPTRIFALPRLNSFYLLFDVENDIEGKFCWISKLSLDYIASQTNEA